MNFFQNRLLVCFFVILRYISLALNFSPSDLYRTEILRKIPYSRKFNHCPSSSLTLLSHDSFYFPPKIQSIIREYRFIVNTQRLSVCFFFFWFRLHSFDRFIFVFPSKFTSRTEDLFILSSFFGNCSFNIWWCRQCCVIISRSGKFNFPSYTNSYSVVLNRLSKNIIHH